MSDGAISQDEIDALLSGAGLGGESKAGADLSALQNYAQSLTSALASGLQTMTGVQVEAGAPTVETLSRGQLLEKLPDAVVTVKADFSAGIAGAHSFVLGADFARKLVDLTKKEETAELDEMALSIISEAVSQHTGAEITELSKLGKYPGLACSPAEAKQQAKAEAQFPDTLTLFSFPLTVEGTAFTLWEAVPQDVAQAMKNALSPAQSAPQGAPGQTGGSGQRPQGAGAPGGPPNVQGLEYPMLQTGASLSPGEQANIGLIYDVYMEMTVELGRTKKQIKEILGMGEGTIIELDKLAGEPVDILVNHKPIAKGEVVVIDENFGVRVTEILSPVERVNELQ